MSNQRPLDSLRADLIRRGLPARYVRRVVEELEDHLQDIVEQAKGVPAPESTLGNLTELADRIVAEFRASRFAGRHPILTFVITPIPLVIMIWIAAFMGLALLSSPMEDAVGATGRNLGAYSIYLGLRFIPFAVTALVLCRAAYRAGRGQWSLVACGLVALLAGSFIADLTFAMGDQEGRLLFGSLFATPGFGTSPLVTVGRQLAQMAVPLAVWLCFAMKFERRRRLAMKAANVGIFRTQPS